MVEARAALAAAERGARLTAAEHVEAEAELSILVDELTVVAVTDDLIARAAEHRGHLVGRGCSFEPDRSSSLARMEGDRAGGAVDGDALAVGEPAAGVDRSDDCCEAAAA